MSGEFTPGPWSIRFDKGHTFSDGTIDHGGYRIDADGVEQLAYVWNFSDRVDPVSNSQDGTRPFGAHDAAANARLIAAAPMLLEANIAEQAAQTYYEDIGSNKAYAAMRVLYGLGYSEKDARTPTEFAAQLRRDAIAAATGETK